jgi:hypothetical protein
MSEMKKEQEARKSGKLEKDGLRLIAVAEKYLTKDHEKICIDDYKRTMHDPNSFQLASELVLNKGAMLYFGNGCDGCSDSFNSGRGINIIANVRGKNVYGGLVLTRLVCHYDWDGKNIILRDSR